MTFPRRSTRAGTWVIAMLTFDKEAVISSKLWKTLQKWLAGCMQANVNTKVMIHGMMFFKSEEDSHIKLVVM